MKKSLLVACAMVGILLSPLSWSNGWMEESTYLKSGDLRLTKSATLIDETVRFVLDTESFSTEVTYSIQPATTPFQANLIFPVLCKTPDPWMESTSSVDERPCVRNFAVFLDGSLIPSSLITNSEENLREFEKDYKTSVYDKRIVDQHFDKDGPYPEVPEKSSNVVLYSAPLKTDKHEMKVLVRYETPYYYNWSGFTKRSFYYYSDDIVYYDFSPANAWSRTELDSLKVIIRPRDTKGPIMLPSEWRFEKTGEDYRSELKDVSLADRHLVFAVNQRAYKQYASHIEALNKYANIAYTLSSDDTLRNEGEDHRPSLAQDGDPNTAWCSSKEQPEIVINVVSKGEAGVVGCYFEGVGMLNGYTKSAALWAANRRVKSGRFIVNDEYESAFTVDDRNQGSQFSPYTKATDISKRLEGMHVSEVRSPQKYWHLTSSDDAVIRLKVEQSYAGTKYKDICISELYPIYNCP